MTQALLRYGAWVEPACGRKWTPTHEAARLGRADMLLLLLRSGGRVNHRDQAGATPLAVAAEHGHALAAELLLSCGESGPRPAPPGAAAMLAALCAAAGSRVNAQACNGDSVLLDAAGSGSTACIRLLLEHGADANLASASGHLPVHKAAFAGHRQ